jgi:hypothetical protein
VSDRDDRKDHTHRVLHVACAARSANRQIERPSNLANLLSLHLKKQWHVQNSVLFGVRKKNPTPKNCRLLAPVPLKNVAVGELRSACAFSRCWANLPSHTFGPPVAISTHCTRRSRCDTGARGSCRQADRRQHSRSETMLFSFVFLLAYSLPTTARGWCAGSRRSRRRKSTRRF